MHQLIQLLILFPLYKLWELFPSKKGYKIKKVCYLMSI